MPPGFSHRGFVSTYAPRPVCAGAGGGGGVDVFGDDGARAMSGGSDAHAVKRSGRRTMSLFRITRTRLPHLVLLSRFARSEMTHASSSTSPTEFTTNLNSFSSFFSVTSIESSSTRLNETVSERPFGETSR
jgi:hypothetical protein